MRATVCTGAVALEPVRAVVIGFTTSGIADDRFVVRGALTLAAAPNPPLDPSQNGLRVVRLDADGSVVYDRTIAPGFGWTSNAAGTVFRFKSDTTRARVASVANDPRHVKISLRDADPFVAQPMLPIGVAVLLDPADTRDQCAEVWFATAGTCSLNGARAVCR
jgi:hypothetical protein